MRKGFVNRWAAFTLMELLITVSIVVVLVALLFSGTKGAVEKGRSAKCLGNLRALASGAMAYSADHDGRFPNSRDFAYAAATSQWYMMLNGNNGRSAVYVEHSGFGSNKGVYFCPSYKGQTRSGSPGWTTYAYNSNLANYIWDGSNWEAARASVVDKKIILFKDAYDKKNNATWYEDPGSRWSSGAWSVADPVHGPTQNVVFVDGHVEQVKVEPRQSESTQGSDCGDMKASWFWPLN